MIQTSFPDKRRDYRFPSWTVSIDYFKGRASKNTFQNLFIKGEEGPQRQDWFYFSTKKKQFQENQRLNIEAVFLVQELTILNPTHQLNGFGGRGPGGQNAPSRIIKHTAVGWDGVGSQIDMGWWCGGPPWSG